MFKKITIFFTCLAFVSLGMSTAFAAAVTDGSSIGGGTDDPGPGLELSLSPSVEIAYAGTADTYGIASFNTKGSIFYGASSENNGVYQKPAGDSATTVPTDAVTAGIDLEDTSGWTPVGGS